MSEYVEIVHFHQALQKVCVREGNDLEKAVAERIMNLEKTAKINYINSRFEDGWPLPEIPLDTPIRIGGQIWEEGVKIREKILKSKGYTNVTADRSISISYEDLKADRKS